MARNALRRALAAGAVGLLLAACAPRQAGATPCTGIDRTLTAAQKQAAARAVAQQLHVAHADILQSFRLDNWRILYVDTHVADDAFLFFPRDPSAAHYVTLWAGAAMPTEGPSIETWVLTHAPGIPKPLAACFAWHVTQDRDE